MLIGTRLRARSDSRKERSIYDGIPHDVAFDSGSIALDEVFVGVVRVEGDRHDAAGRDKLAIPSHYIPGHGAIDKKDGFACGTIGLSRPRWPLKDQHPRLSSSVFLAVRPLVRHARLLFRRQLDVSRSVP